MRRLAILDLGTNTFHLLIVEECPAQGLKILLKKRIYVKLALDGIHYLSEKAQERGLLAIEEFAGILSQYQVSDCIAIGTAALRTASNSAWFINEIQRRWGLKVEIIDGLDEAYYIYRGVAQVWDAPEQPALIMDIGGGSVEFILANRNSLLWSASFDIGVAILYREFHSDEPISEKNRRALQQFLTDQTSELLSIIEEYQPEILIGASGTFDVLHQWINPALAGAYSTISTEEIQEIINTVVPLDWHERTLDKRIPASRVDMIVVALLLIDFILRQGKFQKVGISGYALKEGAAIHHLENPFNPPP